MYKIISISLFSLVFNFFTPYVIQAQDYTPGGYYASVHGGFDLLASNHPALVADGFFNFHLAGYVLTGVDVGKYSGKDNYHISIYRGFSASPKSIEDPDVEPGDKEVELQDLYSIGFTYKKQASRIKNTNRIVVNMGGRITTRVNYYSGVKAMRNTSENSGRPPTYTFNDFGMINGGVEIAPYLEVGKQSFGKKGVFINWELIYFRVGYQHIGLGTQKVSIILKF
ncbi:hypothetical protein [Gracilimonas sp.]|uniref:hypothetical protein n=1 Tax=Gracilimonas sp. TaxID=1974203 RepID=UPI003D0DA1B6